MTVKIQDKETSKSKYFNISKANEIYEPQLFETIMSGDG